MYSRSPEPQQTVAGDRRVCSTTIFSYILITSRAVQYEIIIPDESVLFTPGLCRELHLGLCGHADCFGNMLKQSTIQYY